MVGGVDDINIYIFSLHVSLQSAAAFTNNTVLFDGGAIAASFKASITFSGGGLFTYNNGGPKGTAGAIALYSAAKINFNNPPAVNFFSNNPTTISALGGANFGCNGVGFNALFWTITGPICIPANCVDNTCNCPSGSGWSTTTNSCQVMGMAK